jgi:hypothetical protein
MVIRYKDRKEGWEEERGIKPKRQRQRKTRKEGRGEKEEEGKERQGYEV